MTHNYKRRPSRIWTRKVAVVDFRPEGIPAWNETRTLARRYIEAMRKASGNSAAFRMVDFQAWDGFPVTETGACYDAATYQAALQNDKRALRNADGSYQLADYPRLLRGFGLMAAVEAGNVDEVWLFGGPYFGFYESRMVGRGAYWCNAPGIEMDCRRFVVMGFNYERGVGEMTHNFCHRAESVLAKRYSSMAFLRQLYAAQTAPEPRNEFEQWLVEHGTAHRKPGGEEYGQDEFEWLAAMRREWWGAVVNSSDQVDGGRLMVGKKAGV